MMRSSPAPIPETVGRPQALPVPAYREIQAQLVSELRRARRYERAMSVALVSLRAPADARGERAGGASPAPLGEMTPAVYSLLGSYLRNTLRETDILAAAPEALAFTVFLPETDHLGAAQALGRFRSGFLDCAGVSIQGGVAAYPRDGLTIEDVLDRACEAWGESCRHAAAAAPAAPPAPEARRSHG